jgi:hypothetical protein
VPQYATAMQGGACVLTLTAVCRAQLENVLFNHDGDMKLVDFGFSVMCRDPNKKLKIFCGTPSYMAPEIVMRKCVGRRSAIV